MRHARLLLLQNVAICSWVTRDCLISGLFVWVRAYLKPVKPKLQWQISRNRLDVSKALAVTCREHSAILFHVSTSIAEVVAVLLCRGA